MRCAYVLAIMIVYWTTHALPIAVTALIPMVLYPMLAIVKAYDLAPKYMDESNLTFIASVIVVESIEQVGLHKRFSLVILKSVGLQPRYLLLGFMFVSSSTAMWLQNSVTTALMVPIVHGVTDVLQIAILGAWNIRHTPTKEDGRSRSRMSLHRMSLHRINSRMSSRRSVDVVRSSMGQDNFRSMVFLGVAYASSIGGVSTLIGTSSNLIMKPLVDSTYDSKGCPSPLNFLSWMVYSFPIAVVTLLISWFVLLIRYYGIKHAIGLSKVPIENYTDRIRDTITNMYHDLPPISFKECVVMFHIIAMVLLMMTRQLYSDPLIGEFQWCFVIIKVSKFKAIHLVKFHYLH